jgi:hypothetical protein
MATEVKRRRGTTVEHSTFTGAVAELTVDLTKDTVVVHDGATQGGFPLLREDFSNVPTTAPFTHITLDTAIFDTTYTETGSETQGTLYWNSDEETLSLVTNGETIELGQKIEVHVKNQTGAQINKGEVVYASGTVGNSGRILVTKMIADGTIAAKRVLGVAAENIANGADGKVIKFGKLRKIDTTAFDEGDILWVSTTVAGAFQNTEPSQSAGDIALPIAFVVTDSVNVGEIFIRVTPIDENEYQDYDAGLADIAGLTPSDGNFIVGDGTNWVAESGATALASLGAQAQDPQLDDIAGLTPTDGNFIVGNGTNFVAESGNTARTSLGLGTSDSPTFSRVVLTNQADDGTKALRADRNVSAGNGVTGGGDLTADRTITLGTPSTLTVSTTDAVTTDSHTHALDLSGRSITLSDDADSVITFDTNTQDLGADRTYTPTIADHANGQRGVVSIGAQDIHGSKTVINDFKVTTKVESASGFTSGVLGAGTRYDMDDGNGSFFEVDNMRIRNELRAHIFKKDIVKASNAYLFITDSAEIATTTTITDDTSTFRVVEDGTNASFNHQDLLWAKNLQDDGSLQATGVKLNVMVQPQFVWDKSTQEWDNNTSIPFTGYTEFTSGTDATSGKNFTEYNVYAVESAGTLNAGDTIVRVSGGNILNDASSSQSPFIDIYDGVTEWSQFQDVSKTKVRLGNLAGVSNASGFGLFTENAFLTGSLVVGDLTKVGQYMEFDGSTLTVQGNIIVQSGSSGIGSFTDAGAFATLDTATLSLISDAGAIAAIDAINSGNATTYIGAGAITTGLIAANTIVAGNIAAGTITATEIDANTITANEIASNTITASQIASNTITASEISANTITASEITAGTITATEIATGTITANEIAAGTITATEIDVADLFAQDATVAGTLTIGSGGSLTSNAVTFDDTSFSLDVTDLDIDSATALIQIAHDTTTIPIKFGKTNVGSAPNYDGKYGLEIGSNNYWKVVDGFTTAADYVEFRVGTGTNFIDFDGATIDIEVDTFDLNATTLVIDSATNSGKIALGATPPTGISSGSGIYFDGTGDALIGDATGNRIKFDFSASALEIQSDDFDLSAGNLLIDSGTTSLGSYTPTDATSIITDADFTGSAINFDDHPTTAPNGDFGYLDDSVGWEAERSGNSTFSHNTSGDYIQFTIDSAFSSNDVKIWQDEGYSDSGSSGTLSSYYGKTLTYTYDLGTPPTGNSWQYGDLFLRIYAYKNITDNTQASGYTYFQIAETKVVPSDVTGTSGNSVSVSAVIRDDYEAIRWSVEFPQQDTEDKSADQHIFINNVTLGAYDQTKVTLNSNGLSVFNSPIKQFTADSNGFEMIGMDIKAGGLQVPDIASPSNLKTPDIGYISIGVVDSGSSFRLYAKDSSGNTKYVTISTS